MNHDQYERHVWTVRLLGRTAAEQSVIDVGGEGLLPRFAPGLNVHTANVAGPFAQSAAGGRFDFPDKSFDYAVSIDTLEHIPKDGRKAHIDELIRLATKRVVFCAPIGTPRQIDFQHRLLDSGQLDPVSNQFVKEHIALGMPMPSELDALVPGRIDWFYSGNLKVYVVPGKPPQSSVGANAMLVIGVLVNWFFNAAWTPIKVGRSPKETTNRFYGVIDLSQRA